ncbi:transporter [Tenacibaculum agarivorans]|uniref:transporter n=1 Tax=Tenacibaculum agarivorans TaxID=1908389 RepID=UPI0009F9D355|nr:transporter [Tenacibaculum agarivorans]
MMKRFFNVIPLFFAIPFFAQYTDVINSNRPGFSESPYSVGIGVYQFESSIFHRKFEAEDPTFSNPNATGLDLHFRMGALDEKLEFSLTTSLQSSDIVFTNVFQSTNSKFGFGQFTLGAKYLVYKPTYQDRSKEIRSWNKRHSFDWKRWIPHVAPYVGFNIGPFVNDFHARGGITPKIGVLLQNEFSSKLNVITNIHYNYIGGYLPEWSYVVTGTHNFNYNWSGFIEHQALFNEQESQSNLGLGAAYLFNQDLQINSSLRATFQHENVGYYASVGVSYRLDRHVEQFEELDEFGNKIEDDEVQTYNKGFFGRLFDKIGSIFKKKDKREPQLEEGKEPTEIEPKPRRTRQKSILDDLTKKDEKAKKKTTKEKEKAAKKIKKEEEKAQRQLQKEKEKEEKAKRKEQEKLEKEIKKLEEELKKEEEEELNKKYQEEKKKREKEKEEADKKYIEEQKRKQKEKEKEEENEKDE